MKKFLGFSAFALFCAFILAVKAFADEVIVPPSIDELAALLTSLGGLKGAGALAVAAVVVQGLMLALRSKLGEVAGKWRLLLVYLFSVVSGVVALRISGVDLSAALLHTQTLAALQVLAHQCIVQFGKSS